MNRVLEIATLLENRIGEPKSILEPIDIELIPLKNAVKMIACHMGIKDVYDYTIEMKDLSKESVDVSPKAIGRFNIQNSFVGGSYRYYTNDPYNVTIMLDINLNNYGILQVLCHEMTHHYTNGMQLMNAFNQIPDEALTDYTAVYLGLGKMMINGHTDAIYTRPLNTFGILNRIDKSMMYALTCNINNVKKDVMLCGLRPECLYEVDMLSKYNTLTKEYYDEQKFTNSIKIELKEFTTYFLGNGY